MTVVDFGLRALLLSAALALTGLPARAETDAADPIPTASGPAAPPQAAAPPPLPSVAPQPLDAPDAPPQRDGKMHGMVEASVGSDGSRSAAVAVDAPLPGGGDVSVAVAQSEGGRGRRLRAVPPVD